MSKIINILMTCVDLFIILLIFLLGLVITVEVLDYLGFTQLIDNIEILIASVLTYVIGLFQKPPGGMNGK